MIIAGFKFNEIREGHEYYVKVRFQLGYRE